MAVYKRPDSDYWWYKFVWRGQVIRESTKQGNKRIAEQMEAARKTALAKGEVGIRDMKPAPTLREFAERDFLPFVRSTFKSKPKTLQYYVSGVKSLLAFERLAKRRLDAITGETIAAFTDVRRNAGLQVSSINRELQALRRMFHLAQEWRKVEKVLPSVKMLPGENHRERVLTEEEERLYFLGADSEAMKQHGDRKLMSDIARILLDCGLRPEECFRLRRENILAGEMEILYGKTDNARRRVPATQAVQDVLGRRANGSPWVFPAPTKSGHIEPSSIKKQHVRAAAEATLVMRKETGDDAAEFASFPLYTLRHTCLTRWAPHMDGFLLAYLAGHRDMRITKRYVHPQAETVRLAMGRVRGARDAAAKVQGGHVSGHGDKNKPDGGNEDSGPND